jgi:hypothetical protein
MRFSVKLSDLVSSPIDILFPLFGIYYSIVVANRRQSSPIIAIDLPD